MRVLDLACEQGHLFEGWFGSDADFQSQQLRALIDCPLCGSQKIEKRLSAPHLNLSRAAAAAPSNARTGAQPVAAEVAQVATSAAQQQGDVLRVLRRVLAQTEDVGDQFSRQARQMHDGEIEPRAIRGQTTRHEAAELIEAGVPIIPLPDLPLLKHTLQ